MLSKYRLVRLKVECLHYFDCFFCDKTLAFKLVCVDRLEWMQAGLSGSGDHYDVQIDVAPLLALDRDARW